MMRKPLGRGLDALIGIPGAREDGAGPEAGESSGNPRGGHLATAPVGQIQPGKYQPRIHFDEARLAELKHAIEAQGIIEPLIVRRLGGAPGAEPRYELIAGERRLRAARAAGLATVPIVIRELDDRAALEMALVENIAREDLSAIEEAIAFKRLSKLFSLSHDDIAARVGKSRPYVTNAVRLLELPQAVVEMIACGQLSAGQARPLLAIGSAEGQIAAARSIVAGRVTARGAEEIASAHRELRKSSARGVGDRAGGDQDQADPNMGALAEGLQRAFKRKVRIVRGRGKNPGRIEIDYYDENDLTALAETLMAHTRGRAAAIA